MATIDVDPSHIYDTSTSSYWSNLAPNTTDGPMNRDSVWIDSDGDGSPDALSAGTKTTIAFQYNNTGGARVVYVGIGGDDLFQLKLNGAVVAEVTDPSAVYNFKYWHIIPVTLLGHSINNFNLVGTGDGSVNDAIAMVVYDNTAVELSAANDDTDLNILFRSSQLIGQTIDVATCAPGYSLDTSAGSGSYVCKLRETAAPTGDGGINTGMVHWNTRARIVNGAADGYTEPNAAGTNFIPDEMNTALCPVANPVPEVITISGTVKTLCSDKGCTQIGFTSLVFSFATPTPVAMELLVGFVKRVAWSGDLRYAGSDIFTPPVGSAPDAYYGELGGNVPFRINIPAGVTAYTVPAIIFQDGGGMVGGFTKGAWTCHSCQYPITQLYFKIDNPDTGYALNLTSSSSPLTVYNV
jgi:hypothetical protein